VPSQQASVQGYSLAFALTSLVSIAAVGGLLSLRLGRRLGLRLMWAIAAMPCVVLVQVCEGMPCSALAAW
jgi:hypothetical protein